MYETAFVELGRVEHSNDFVGLLNHDLVEERFFQTRRGNAAFQREGIDSEEEFVATEIAQHGERQRSDSGMAAHPQVAAEENYFESFVVEQFCGDIHRVGEDMQVVEFVEVSCDFERGGPGIEHDVIAVFDEFGRFFADAFFFFEVEHPLFGDSSVLVLVLDRFAHGTSTSANQEVSVLEDCKILSDGNFRNASFPTQFCDQNFFFLLK